MKQNLQTVYLQISTAQGPAECRIFARFVLGRLLAEAQAEGVEVEIISETADKHGIMSAVLKLDGKHAETLAQRWQGSLQWVCASPVRPKHPRKNWYKTESAVRATHKASGISVRVESERSQHANKKLALTLLAQKLAEHYAGQTDDYARAQHSRLYQVERGNPKRTFVGTEFKEKSDSKR